MKAIRERDGVLRWVDEPTPVPGPGEVRIRVCATAVNRADLVQRAGHYPPPPGASDILGLECAGVIDAVGAGVTERREGDEVVALLAGGGYAEQVCCLATHTLPRPASLGWAEAAAIMEVFTTAWLNLRREGALRRGERVLIHAGASGVGTAAVQLCRWWGCPCFVTVGREAKIARCVELGAEGGALRHEDWEAAVRAFGPLDLILCPVGGAYLQANLRLLRTEGRLVIIGLMGGREGTLPLGRLLVKRLTVRGSVLRSRPDEEKARIVAGVGEEIWPAIEAGDLRPIVHRILPIEQADIAHRLVAANETVGKVVLALPECR